MMLPKINGAFRISREPQTREVGNTTITNFGVVASEKYKDKETTVFIDCKAWGGLGSMISSYFDKGDQIFISGKIEMEQYQNKDNVSITKHVINVQDVDFGQKSRNNSANDNYSSGDMDSDDIPFAPFMNGLIQP